MTKQESDGLGQLKNKEESRRNDTFLGIVPRSANPRGGRRLVLCSQHREGGMGNHDERVRHSSPLPVK